jgi:hypothetical protein
MGLLMIELVLHRLSGDTGFEFGTQMPSFSFTHLVLLMSGLVALKNQLNSSINHWLRFLGPLQRDHTPARLLLVITLYRDRSVPN